MAISNLQAVFNGVCADDQRERVASQMTLGELIEKLKTLPNKLIIMGLGDLDSYRGYYCDLAFELVTDEKSVETLLDECKAAMGKVFRGYKGGDYMMGESTPLWVASFDTSIFLK